MKICLFTLQVHWPYEIRPVCLNCACDAQIQAVNVDLKNSATCSGIPANHPACQQNALQTSLGITAQPRTSTQVCEEGRLVVARGTCPWPAVLHAAHRCCAFGTGWSSAAITTSLVRTSEGHCFLPLLLSARNQFWRQNHRRLPSQLRRKVR